MGLTTYDDEFLLAAIVIISMALIFYSVGVWSERIQGRLKGWHVTAFGLGLVCQPAFHINQKYNYRKLSRYYASCFVSWINCCIRSVILFSTSELSSCALIVSFACADTSSEIAEIVSIECTICSFAVFNSSILSSFHYIIDGFALQDFLSGK